MRRLLPLLLAAACAGPPEPLTLPKQLDGPVVRYPRAGGAAPVLYPEELWDAGVEGTTLLRVHIGAAGAVDSARVERSSGYAAFDEAALAGSRGVRFEPARRGAEAVPAWFILPVEFDLGPAADSAAARPASSSQQAGFR